MSIPMNNITVPFLSITVYNRGMTDTDTSIGGNRIVIVDGHGVIVKVDQSHLIIETNKRITRFTRALPPIRLVIIGWSGIVTLSAMQWCRHVGTPIICISPDNEVLWTSSYTEGGQAKNDARLRRTQATMMDTPAGLELAKALLNEKLSSTDQCADLSDCKSVPELLTIEGQAAANYFRAWKSTIRFCRPYDVPDHWRTFNSRKSLLTSRNKNASDPINAILNYLYTVASTECRIACFALGLDPGLGFLHHDSQGRESLVWDLMETIRGTIDLFVRAMVKVCKFDNDDFRESVRGMVRVKAPLKYTLASTGPLWWRAVAPHAETVLHHVAKTSKYQIDLSTPLTATYNRNVHGRRAYRPIDMAKWIDFFPPDHSCHQCQ